MNFARVILGNVRAGIKVMIKSQQGYRIRLVITHRAQGQRPSVSAVSKSLRFGEGSIAHDTAQAVLQSLEFRVARHPGGNGPIPQRTFVGNDLDQGGGVVFRLHAGGERSGTEKQLTTESFAGLYFFAFTGHGAGGHGIGQIFFHL